jgi:hypothetical protein
MRQKKILLTEPYMGLTADEQREAIRIIEASAREEARVTARIMHTGGYRYDPTDTGFLSKEHIQGKYDNAIAEILGEPNGYSNYDENDEDPRYTAFVEIFLNELAKY